MHSQSFMWMMLATAISRFHVSALAGDQRVRRQDGPVPPGTIGDCTYFYNSQSGDTCASIASDWGISLQDFVTYNPSVKSDCSGLIIGDAYCVEENYGMGPKSVSSTSSMISTTTPATSTGSAGPSPTQSGITGQCNTSSEFKGS